MMSSLFPRPLRLRQAATAMACSQADTDQRDRLSVLPDELLVTILSFLPTPIAARTSVLCRRFRRLWEASPSLQLIYSNLIVRPHHRFGRHDKFVAQADRVILHRNPSYSLHSLHLELPDFDGSLPDSYISSLLSKAASLGLCHLTISGSFHVEPILPIVFSIKTLKSLALPDLGVEHYVFPSGFTLTSLTSLSLGFSRIDPPKFSQLLSELRSLEELQLNICSIVSSLIISSQTIRKLKLEISGPKLDTLRLVLPSLESIHLTTGKLSLSLFHIHGEVPLLKRAMISLDELHARDVSAVTKLLNFISHLEEFRLHLRESKDEKIPIHILLEPGKDVPNFPNLKHLYVRLCFHKPNFEDVILMLHNCPALESLKLVQKSPKITRQARGRKREDWCSNLPRRRNVNFRNLHLGMNKRQFMKLLGEKLM